MALIAETVGAQPIDFGDGAGAVIKGADAAAGLYAAKQKAEQVGLQLEDMRLRQDQMKAGVFLDYMDKIKNAPNPAIRKILEKQYANQHQKMYGSPMDSQTLKAIADTPEFGETIQSLMDQMGIQGAGRSYIDAINNAAKALGLPYVDAIKLIKEAFEIQQKELQSQAAIKAATARAAGTQGRFDTSQENKAIDFEQSVSKDIETKKNKLVGIARNLNIFDKSKNVERLSQEEQIRFDDQLIVAYNKMQDPPSVVMPSEYMRTLMATPLFDRLEAVAGRHIMGKGILNKKDREVMAEAVQNFTRDQVDSFNNFVEQSAERVKERGANFDRIASQKFSINEPKNKQGEVGVGAQSTGITSQQRSMIDQYIQRNVPYDVFAQKNPKTSKVIGRAEYEKMMTQKAGGK